MKKIAIGIALGMTLAGSAAANGPGCGLGSMIFAGQSGVVPQVAAATTNGSFGNQTFGISSGTLGCSQNDTVQSRAKLGLFLDSNMEKVARDMSAGEGESLAAVADLLGVEAADRARFNTAMRDNFGTIFSSTDVTSEGVVDNIKRVMASTADLARYADKV
jgi:hypothetical protein